MTAFARLWTRAFLAVPLLVASLSWAQAPVPSAPGMAEAAPHFRVREGFEAPLTLKTAQGKVFSLKAARHTWSVDASLGQQSVHIADFTLFHLRAGKISEQVEGQAVLRGVDSYWTLPAGAVFTFEVKGETALLETMTVSLK